MKIKSKNIEIDTLKQSKQELLVTCPRNNSTAMFKLMNGTMVEDNGNNGDKDMLTMSAKKVVGNGTMTSVIGSVLLPEMRQKSVRNLISATLLTK